MIEIERVRCIVFILIFLAAEIAEELARLKGEEEEAQRQFDREQAEKRGQQVEEEQEGGEQEGMDQQDVGVPTEEEEEEEEEEEQHVVSLMYPRVCKNL